MKKVVLRISGVSNINSSNELEKGLKKNHKIKNADMDIKTGKVTIYCKQDLLIDDIEKEIDSLGYESLGVDLINTSKKPSFLPTILLGILLLGILYLTIANIFHLPFAIIFSRKITSIFWLISLLIFLVYGLDIIIEGIKDFIIGNSTLYTLGTLTIMSSTIYGSWMLYNFCKNQNTYQYIYLEIAMFLIYFLKIGQYINKRNKYYVESEISQISNTKIDKVNRKEQDSYEEINIEEVKVGNVLLCLPGDKVLLDGSLLEDNHSHFDESLIRGESTPCEKGANAKILAGSINYESEIEYKVDTILKDSYTAKIKKMVAEEKSTKQLPSRRIDRFCRYWVPIIFLGYFIIGVLYYLMTKNLTETVTKICILFMTACPFGFALATPLSFHRNSKEASKKRLFIKKMETLEQARRIDTVVLDKTGTVTNGYLSIARINNHSDMDDKKLLELLGSIEKHSTHALARGITKFLRNEKIASTFDLITEDLPGYGVKARDDENTYYACNSELLKKLDIINPYSEEERKLQVEGNTVIYLTKNNKVIGTIGLRDIAKKETKKVIKALQERNINVILLTGDNETVSMKIAKELGIKYIKAEMNPAEKKDYVKDLINAGHKVLMVGDGINDAPSLTASTIGIALKTASDISISASDIMMESSNLFKILDLFIIGQNMLHLVKQNIVLSIGIYLTELIIALGIIPKISMNPLILIIGMLMSTIFVIGNTLRLKINRNTLKFKIKN